VLLHCLRGICVHESPLELSRRQIPLHEATAICRPTYIGYLESRLLWDPAGRVILSFSCFCRLSFGLMLPVKRGRWLRRLQTVQNLRLGFVCMVTCGHYNNCRVSRGRTQFIMEA
jgi:hypothetical protein